MKKKTKLQRPSEEGEARSRQHGPQKEKTQITIRVDKELINEAYAQMKEDNTRITDIIERGIYLALKERDHDMPPFTKQIRFVLANATREQQVLLRGLAIAMVEPLLEPKPVAEGQKRVFIAYGCPADEKLYELVRWFLESRNKLPHASACLEYYSRYGKSAEEIAKLGSL
jgi:hypothetical protein